MELLEIAKASPAKSLGIANPDLPDGLRTVPIVKETNCATAVLYATKFELSHFGCAPLILSERAKLTPTTVGGNSWSSAGVFTAISCSKFVLYMALRPWACGLGACGGAL